YQRLRTMETLAKQRAGALEDLRGAQLTYDRSRFDEITKAQALNLAQRELHQDRTLVAMHEIRTKIDGVIKTIHKRQGEVVRSLEPAFHVENSRRIRVEGFVESQFLPVLQEMKRQGKKVHLDPALPTPPNIELTGHLQEVTAVAVNKDAKNPLLVSGSEDGTARVWDLSNRRQRSIFRHPVPVRAVACTGPAAVANLCATGAADGSIRLWDLNEQAPVPRDFADHHRGAVNSLSFSSDGRWCASGGDDHAVCLWETATGKLRQRVSDMHR